MSKKGTFLSITPKMTKKIVILSTIICATFCAFAQDDNEKLYKAIVEGDSSIVKQLLNNHADPDYKKLKASG